MGWIHFAKKLCSKLHQVHYNSYLSSFSNPLVVFFLHESDQARVWAHLKEHILASQNEQLAPPPPVVAGPMAVGDDDPDDILRGLDDAFVFAAEAAPAPAPVLDNVAIIDAEIARFRAELGISVRTQGPDGVITHNNPLEWWKR